MFSKIKKPANVLLGRAGWELRRRSSQHVTPITAEWLGNFLYYSRMYDRIRNIPGAIVECGVGRGRTFLFLAFLVEEEGQGRELWGIDSFAGFPKPTPEDQRVRNPQEGEKPADREMILWMLRDAGLKPEFIQNQVKLIPGFFETSLTAYRGRDIALLHADVDLYRSYREVLGTLYPRVTNGGVVLFDEYHDPAFPGATKAVDEYFSGKNVRIERHPLSRKYYLIKP